MTGFLFLFFFFCICSCCTRQEQVSVKQLKLLLEADDLLPLPAALAQMLLQLLCIKNSKTEAAGADERQQVHVSKRGGGGFSF